MSSFQFWQRYSLPDLVPGSLFAPRCRRFGARGHNGCARTRELTRLSFHTRIQPFPRNACRQSVLQSDVSPLAPMQLSADRVICLSTDAVVASITPSNHRGCSAPQAPTSAVQGVADLPQTIPCGQVSPIADTEQRPFADDCCRVLRQRFLVLHHDLHAFRRLL